jgi:replication factor C large subunit
MEKQKAQMRVEERDRRAEELQNQMMNVIPEAEEPSGDDELPFEIQEIDETPQEVIEEPEIIEEEEKVEEKKEKKADKQTTLFSF